MNWLFSLYVAVLFFILTPAVLLRIPKNGSKYKVAGVHAVVFALLLHFTGKFVWNVSMSMEGFSEGVEAKDRSGVKTKELTGGAMTDDPKKQGKFQEKGKDLCAQDKGKTWNDVTQKCEADPNKADAAKTDTDANRAKRSNAKKPGQN